MFDLLIFQSTSMSQDTGLLTTIETISAGDDGGNPISVAQNPSGDKLYVAKNGGKLQVFNVNKTNGALTLFQSIAANSLGSSSVAVSQDGRFVYVSSYNGTGTIFSVSSLTGTLMQYKALDFMASKLVIHPNGDMMMFMGSAGVTFWPINKSSGDVLIAGSAYTASVSTPNSIVLNPDGSKMYLSHGTGYGLINSYNVDSTNRTGSYIDMVGSGTNFTDSLAISNFGKILLATEPNTNLLHSFLINSSTGKLTEVESKTVGTYPRKVIFFPDGQYALVINVTSKTISSILVDENSGSLKVLGSANVGNGGQDLVIIKTN